MKKGLYTGKSAESFGGNVEELAMSRQKKAERKKINYGKIARRRKNRIK